MTARVLNGMEVAAEIRREALTRVSILKESGIEPGLGIILVGDNPASRSYVSGKQKDCEEVGIRPIAIELPASASYQDVSAAVQEMNTASEVSGFIVQLPLPGGIRESQILELINPEKDADGLHPTNLGRLVMSEGQDTSPSFPLPCTPAGIWELLTRKGIDLSGQCVTVIGRGLTVGRPLGLLLSRKGIDATVCLTHSRTQGLEEKVHASDVVVAALGVPHFVRAEWIKPGAVVVDVGVSRTGTSSTGKAILSGDVHPAVADVAGWVSPTPGGVGPMTRAMLISNVVSIAERKRNEMRLSA